MRSCWPSVQMGSIIYVCCYMATKQKGCETLSLNHFFFWSFIHLPIASTICWKITDTQNNYLVLVRIYGCVGSRPFLQNRVVADLDQGYLRNPADTGSAVEMRPWCSCGLGNCVWCEYSESDTGGLKELWTKINILWFLSEFMIHKKITDLFLILETLH